MTRGKKKKQWRDKMRDQKKWGDRRKTKKWGEKTQDQKK